MSDLQEQVYLLKRANTIWLDIGLDPSVAVALKGSVQDKYYQQETTRLGCFPEYRLQKEGSTKYSLLGPNGEVLSGKNLNGIYSFVILADPLDPKKLELVFGKFNHAVVSRFAPFVKGAGDTEFQNAEIDEETNRSGAYHFSIHDPFAFEKYESSLSAMETVGLPLDKFVPFVDPDIYLVKRRELLFSSIARSGFAVKDPELENENSTLQTNFEKTAPAA